MSESMWEALRAAFAGARKDRSRFPTVRIRLEALEDRANPNAFAVNTFDDTSDCFLVDGVALDVNGKTSLRAAIQEADFLGGDHTISFPMFGSDNPPPPATIALQTTLDTITANINILGPGAGSLTVARGQTGVVGIFHVAADSKASISGLTIAGGVNAANPGGGIDNAGNLTVIGCVIQNCVASAGGGFYNSGQISVQGCQITGNTATNDRGGGMFNGGQATLFQTVFYGNQAPAQGGRGGGLAQVGASASTTVTDSRFEQNSAISSGGGSTFRTAPSACPGERWSATPRAARAAGSGATGET